ncbi:hypothetical protein HRG_008905 [Hirsutella rhossiliensis]|uniref:Uncharacterized protein n=1 Tax=Hirsutella rhossiliensis TaxID=111463 RepID=A0A9P8SFB8_9HYPO|nr:uncharacterized protein HRG_08905 [Hirsutella rhossiliensis]KAH0959884.1 hypothetical protein HRG_08905 [Hirsutella rhossiliensis]
MTIESYPRSGERVGQGPTCRVKTQHRGGGIPGSGNDVAVPPGAIRTGARSPVQACRGGTPEANGTPVRSGADRTPPGIASREFVVHGGPGATFGAATGDWKRRITGVVAMLALVGLARGVAPPATPVYSWWNDAKVWEHTCSAAGVAYAVLTCAIPGGWGYFSICTVNGSVIMGTPNGAISDGHGIGYGCGIVDVLGPNRGYTPGIVGKGVAGPVRRWLVQPETRATPYGWPSGDRGMHGPKAHVPSKADRARLAAEALAGGHEGVQEHGGQSYCDMRGLPSMVYLCNLDGAPSLAHYCRDAERGWWYDLFGNQLADFGAAGYCHMLGVRVPSASYAKVGSSGRGLPVLGTSVGVDYSHKHQEPLNLTFTVGRRNLWAPFPYDTPEPLECVGGKVVLEADTVPVGRRSRGRPARKLEECADGPTSSADRIPDRDISGWETTCMPGGKPYVVLACWTGGHLTYASFCGGTSGEPGISWREGLGLFHDCRPTSVRAPGRGWGKGKGGPKRHDWGWFSYTGSRWHVYGHPRPDLAVQDVGVGVGNSTADLTLTAAPWGVGAGSKGDRWDGRSYCDRQGLPSLVYMCHGDGGFELLHFCRDAERGWWYDLHHNQMSDDGAARLCHPVGIRVPPAPFQPRSGSGRRLPSRRMAYGGDMTPWAAEHRDYWTNASPGNPWVGKDTHRRAWVCDADGSVTDPAGGGPPKRAPGVSNESVGPRGAGRRSWADGRSQCVVTTSRVRWG